MAYTGEELDAAILTVIGPYAWRFRDGSDGISRGEALIHCGAVLFASNARESLAGEIIRHALGRTLEGREIELSPSPPPFAV